MRYPRILICMGLVAIAFAWVVIGASWILNPWFVFTEDAFSDFGGPESCCPELYNYGLMVAGMLIVLYGLAICIVADEKLEVAGGSYVILAGVFLALIGVFPSGTKPHTFVSSWFFIQMYMAFMVLGVGMHRRGLKYGREIAAISALSIPIAVILELIWGWPSAAVLETYGVIIIDICVILASITYLSLARTREYA